MRQRVLLGFSGFLFVAASMSGAQRNTTPRFEDFPATPRQSRPAPAAIAKGQGFATQIREGAKKGPNFAGHYTIVEWGCGSGCESFVVVDALTGRVFHASPFSILGVPYKGTSEGRDYQGLVYRINSSLLVADGCPEDEGCGTRYYKWEREQFQLLGSSPGPPKR